MATVVSSPAPSTRNYVIACERADVAALAPMLALGPIAREQRGLHTYLDLCVSKPWGYELKIYEDALSEAWMLVLERLTCTSMHAHPCKTTILVCVAGEGELTSGDGERIELLPGTVVEIMPGARHQSSTRKGMRLIEFECPADKFDLVRYEDPTRPRGSAYETAAEAHTAAVPEPAPLVAVPAGPPRARLRACDAGDSYRFGLETGAHVKARPAGLCAAISLDLVAIMRREFSVVTPGDLLAAADREPHLTIRRAPAR